MGSYPKYGIILLLVLILPWKSLFYSVLVIGSLIAVSAPSWFTAWIGLEINILAFITLLFNFNSPRNSEAALKYFLIQALASSILISIALISSSCHFPVNNRNNISLIVITLRLLIKLGAAPFHLWVPQIVEGLSWTNRFILLSWQKIAPFLLIENCFETKFSKILLFSSAFLSAILGALGGLSQTSSRKILAFSSINHVSWIIFSIFLKITLWSFYFLIYSSLLFIFINFLSKFNITSISHSQFSLNPFLNLSFFISLLSFGGLPPFTGFLPKWFVITELSHFSAILTIILIITRLLTLFFYLRLCISSVLKKSKIIFPIFFSKPYFPSSTLILNCLGLILSPLIFIF